jgi:hypothetical protein
LPPIKKCSKSGRDLDKYYIAPNLRYKTHHSVPHRPLDSNDDHYIYRNLHNSLFWDRPLVLSEEKSIIKRELTDKANLPALRRFK